MRSLKFILIFLVLIVFSGCINHLGKAEITLENGDKLNCDKLNQKNDMLYCFNKEMVIAVSILNLRKIEFLSE